MAISDTLTQGARLAAEANVDCLLTASGVVLSGWSTATPVRPTRTLALPDIDTQGVSLFQSAISAIQQEISVAPGARSAGVGDVAKTQ